MRIAIPVKQLIKEISKYGTLQQTRTKVKFEVQEYIQIIYTYPPPPQWMINRNQEEKVAVQPKIPIDREEWESPNKKPCCVGILAMIH